ncbi:NUDIX domain-containing protein [Candidatus Woesearchaeota archaeon]|nr:NUDIX domain-containing protein [Candidatus Woesearchaeota archaeon]
MTKQQYPEPVCGALIFNPEGKLFLMKSHKWKNKYVVPGGHVEVGETIISALKREIKEETGMKVFDIRPVGFQEVIFDKAYWKRKHFLFFDFACKTRSTKIKLNSEAQAYVWVKIEEALRLPMNVYTRKAIKEYLKEDKKKIF